MKYFVATLIISALFLTPYVNAQQKYSVLKEYSVDYDLKGNSSGTKQLAILIQVKCFILK